MKPSILFFLFFLSRLALGQYAEGVSKAIIFGKPTTLQMQAEGESQPIHFFSSTNKEVASALSNTVAFGAREANAQPSKSTAQPATRAKEVVKKEETSLSFETVPTYYALIIGESVYQNANTSFGNLDRPVKDAQALYTTLTSRYFFSPDRVNILNNATRGEILEAFEELGKKVTAKDNLLVFYAGHGVWDANLQIGYWLPADAQPEKKYTWISNSSIKDYLSGIQSKHTLLITDACFSGSIFKTRGQENLSDFGMAKLYALPSRKAMTSGNLKSVPDQSKFFEFLNKRLAGNTEKFISARELFNNLYTAVLNNTNSVPLYGVLQDTGDEGGEFIFIRRDK
jgi:hypothetical protein